MYHKNPVISIDCLEELGGDMRELYTIRCAEISKDNPYILIYGYHSIYEVYLIFLENFPGSYGDSYMVLRLK
jgi:hypothetical protein